MNLVRAFTFVVLLFTVPVVAQVATTQTEKKSSVDNAANKSSEKTPAKAIKKNLQSEVRFLLISLASDAATFRDQPLRARSLARIADALWTLDVDQGKRLFRNAWEAAQIADQSDTPYNLGESPPNLRNEVLSLAARRDRLLAEEFLKKLQVEKPTADDGNSARGNADALTQRLLLASELLRAGDTQRALEFAKPALGSVTIGTIEFLTNLRVKEPRAADAFYLALATGPRAGMDATTISLLSSYLFTPHVYVTFNADGGANRMGFVASAAPVEVEPQLRHAFFQTATEVLLRSQLRSEPQQRTSETLIDYVTLRHLLPMFDAYAAPELTQTVRAQFEALRSSGNLTPPADNESQQPSETENLSNQEQTLLEKIDRAKTSAERDDLYFRLALSLLQKNDVRARDYVGKIDATLFREQAETWIDTGLAINAVEKKRTDLALQLARTGALSHIHKVWIFTQAAELLAKSDREKALSLLDEATAEVRRIETALDRPRGLFAIAHAVLLIEPGRAREAILDAVKAANSTEGFTGERGELALTVNGGRQILNSTFAVPEFDLTGVFEQMASSDYETAVQLARGFQADAPRANATIAISRSILKGGDDALSPQRRRSGRNQ